MLVICNHSDGSGHHTPHRRKRRSASGAWPAIILLPLIAGCTATQLGPGRPITIEEDVANIRIMAEPDLSLLQFPTVAERNQIITARMYIADLEYHKYEAKLTRDLQEEGLAATLAVLGLTSVASLITVASTSRILAGTATVVTGADKAFSDKVLLSNTIQALQAQMRADRQTQAAVIISKMPTPIAQYTLPMALSDVDKYYQAGTLASALIGLQKTVAIAEQRASTAHDLAGPNGEVVSAIRMIANPPPLTNPMNPPPLTNPIVRPPRPPKAARISATFGPDDSTAILQHFIDPTGTGNRDPDRVNELAPLLAGIIDPTTGQPLRTPRDLTRFLQGSEFATQRRNVVKQLRAAGKL
jgi:hypothetical protein